MDPTYKLIAELISAAGSLASMVDASISGYKLFRKSDTAELGYDYRAYIANARAKSPVASPSPTSQDAIKKVPIRYLEPIRNRLIAYENDYLALIGDPGSTEIEMKKTLAIVSKDVCSLLQLIKRHNSGELPDDPLFKELWNTFSCDKRAGIMNLVPNG
jgi:hypothetical protein